jgi:hypothetical protein
MQISADNQTDHAFRVVRKSDGQVVQYVTVADTDAGTYMRLATGADGKPIFAASRIVKEVREVSGVIRRFDAEGNEVEGEQEPFVMEEVSEPFRIVVAGTHEVVAETSEAA